MNIDDTKCKDCYHNLEGKGTADGFCEYCDSDRQYGVGDQRCSKCGGPFRRGRCMNECESSRISSIARRIASKWLPNILNPDQRLLVSTVGKDITWNTSIAGAFCVALLEDVNMHSEADKLNTALSNDTMEMSRAELGLGDDTNMSGLEL